jgi:hypothetical protein
MWTEPEFPETLPGGMTRWAAKFLPPMERGELTTALTSLLMFVAIEYEEFIRRRIDKERRDVHGRIREQAGHEN